MESACGTGHIVVPPSKEYVDHAFNEFEELLLGRQASSLRSKTTSKLKEGRDLNDCELMFVGRDLNADTTDRTTGAEEALISVDVSRVGKAPLCGPIQVFVFGEEELIGSIGSVEGSSQGGFSAGEEEQALGVDLHSTYSSLFEGEHGDPYPQVPNDLILVDSLSYGGPPIVDAERRGDANSSVVMVKRGPSRPKGSGRKSKLPNPPSVDSGPTLRSASARLVGAADKVTELACLMGLSCNSEEVAMRAKITSLEEEEAL